MQGWSKQHHMAAGDATPEIAFRNGCKEQHRYHTNLVHAHPVGAGHRCAAASRHPFLQAAPVQT